MSQGTPTMLRTLKDKALICIQRRNEVRTIAQDTSAASLSHNVVMRELVWMIEAQCEGLRDQEDIYAIAMGGNGTRNQERCDNAMIAVSKALHNCNKIATAARALKDTLDA